MKKNILMLINGFGIEQNDSYDLYNSNLMPNLDNLTKTAMFSTIKNNFFDYKEAYRKFSMGIDYPLTYTLIDNNISNVEYEQNELFKYIINELKKNESNIHLFCYWESSKIVEQLIMYVKYLESKTKSKIFLHFILCQKSVNQYESIKNGLNKLNYEFGQRVKIGMITGENEVNNKIQFKEIMKSFLTEASEKWKDISKKIDVCIENKVKPCDIRSFAVDYGYRIEEKDQILFFNYHNIDITDFKKELIEQKYRKFDFSTITIYSLFPVKCDVKIPFMYNYALSADYFLNSISKINARCLILEKQEKCPYINYYLTGLRNQVDEHIKFLAIDDNILFNKDKLIEIFKNYDKELYIVNYQIDNCKTIEEMAEKLKNIDQMIGIVRQYAKENKYGFIVSSLYGIQKEMYNKRSELCRINFSSKVPLILEITDLDLTEYTINDGNLYDLSNTLLFLINNNYENKGFLRKKSKLFSFLYKKPKKNNS